MNKFAKFVIDHNYTGNNNYVFKSCQIKWIIILQKLNDTITNENRNDIYDIETASFRANKLKVICIVNKFNPKININKIINSIYTKKNITYTVNEIVCVDDYDMDINNIYSSGIHYYKSLDPAFYSELDLYKKYIGNFFSYHNNGRIEVNGFIINGNFFGERKYYDDCGFHIMNG